MINRLIAIGDIHGCYDPLRELIEGMIIIRKSDRIILLGDYIDRGYDCKAVVDYILDLQEKNYDIIPLLGNHELMLLDSVRDERNLSCWFMNGGYETLVSFSVDSPGEMEKKYLDFFSSLRYYFLMDQFIFVHAGFNNEISDPLEDKYHMVWSRRENYSHPFFIGKLMVHGHTPVPLSVCRDMNLSGSMVMNIDTGCVYDEWGGYGYLTAFELFTRELISVKA
jgi:serine/threonine protein phosphatase 1